MPAIRSGAKIAEKWAEVTPLRSTQYEDGVRDPLRDWQKNTEAAHEAWKSGVQDAIAKGRFPKGVNKAGNSKWQSKSIAKGPSRFREGVSIAGPDYEKGFAPFRDVIERTTLPPRFAKGDPRNIQRVAVMAAALAEARRK